MHMFKFNPLHSDGFTDYPILIDRISMELPIMRGSRVGGQGVWTPPLLPEKLKKYRVS